MSEFKLTIIDDKKQTQEKKSQEYWFIAIIDDVPLVHKATTLALVDTEILGRKLKFLSAYSAKEGYKLIKDNPDLAVILLDVVMEGVDSGLKLVDEIRGQLNRKNLQIILRTGQSGYAPEEEVILRYEINDYKVKSELNKKSLVTSIATALRTYRHLSALEQSRKGLRSVIDASGTLIRERSVNNFAQGVLVQLNALFNISPEGVFCVSQRPRNGPTIMQASRDNEYYVVATSEKYNNLFDTPIKNLPPSQMKDMLLHSLKIKQHIITDDYSALYLSTPSSWEGIIILENVGKLALVDQELLQVFCINVSLGLENAKFFTYLNKVAYFDEVTDLYNRRGFLDHSVGYVSKNKSKYSLFLIDIDYFHKIIEALGYNYGDDVLKQLATNLKHVYDAHSIIARLHSDVFALLSYTEDLTVIDIAKQCAKPLIVNESTIRLGVTVGGAQYKGSGFSKADVDILLQQAEIALKVAKQHRRGSGLEFKTSYENHALEQLAILNDFRKALIAEELYLVLQPKVCLITGKVNGYEALLRWQHPEKGLIPPGKFIPVVEQSGLFFNVDLYVFRKACEILRQYPQINVPIAINISANSLHHHDFIQELSLLHDQLAPKTNLLELEITENALIGRGAAINHLNNLKDRGFRLCIDDFGAGYSSLSYLLKIPLDVIKIDRAFVASITEDKDAVIVLKGIVDIGQQLKKILIVEGVETQEQLNIVKSLNVATVQGFFFYKPLAVDEAVKLLEQP